MTSIYLNALLQSIGEIIKRDQPPKKVRVGTHETSIEINGRRYDARTGKPVAGHASAPTKPAVMDVAPRNTHTKQVHAKPQRSKTLMRHAVKKPAKLTPQHSTTNKPMTDIAAPSKRTTLIPSTLYHQPDPEREKRASAIKRSSLVRKFSSHTGQSSAPVGFDQPVPQRVEPMAVQPAPTLAQPIKIAPAHSVIERGLRAAQSHSETPHKAKRSKGRRRTRLASISAGALAVVLLGTFFAYQNLPNISMRYASTRAGISANLPTYRPSGFALNHRIEYTPGQITINFNSNSDDRKFTITQRESTWNSETLRSNYVAEKADNIQTFEDKGRTIYLYGDSNATWVNAGVWYDINGDSQLNSDQLIRIATSM